MTARVVIAVDGGNSKTDVAVVDGDGNVLGTTRGPGASFTPREHRASAAKLERTVREAVRVAGLDGAEPAAEVGVFCLAGADLPADDRRILRALRGMGLVAEPVLRNDTFAVMRAGAPRGWGVAVVCGAGFNCTGVGPDGREVRFEALGPISGDWGGGRVIGLEAVGACARARDGRGPRTVLERTVPAHFGVRTPRALLEALHTERIDESRLLELPPVVLAAADEGDGVAAAIVERQAQEVAAMACAAIRRLRLGSSDVDVVLGGGVARARNGVFMDRLAALVAECAPRARIAVVDEPPVVGAALVGLDRLGATAAAGARVREQLDGARFDGRGTVA